MDVKHHKSWRGGVVEDAVIKVAMEYSSGKGNTKASITDECKARPSTFLTVGSLNVIMYYKISYYTEIV